MVTVLDAWAVIAVLMDEPGAPRIEGAIAAGGAGISWINLGEAYYTVVRRQGRTSAAHGLRRLGPVLFAEEPDRELILAAATIKVAGGLSYADCFALATAARHRAPLLTGDPEIIANAGEIEVVDLRSGA